MINFPSGRSQGGLIIFLQGEKRTKMPHLLAVEKLERTVKSTTAAEAQALVDGSEMAVYLLRILTLIIGDTSIRVKCYTDKKKSLVDALTSTKQMIKKLKADTLVLAEIIE